MGMAASQARLLNLTARRTNIEYQGQQINQQRTELSNQSANLYNQLLTLQVPVPPNTRDFTKVEYTFNIPGKYDTPATITQISKTTTPGEYTIIFTYKDTVIGFPACATKERSDVTDTHDSGTSPRYDGSELKTYKGKTATLTKIDDTGIHKDAYNALSESGSIVVYVTNIGTEEKPVYQYYKESDIDNAKSLGGDNHCVYYMAGEVEEYHEDSYTPCTISRDASNRVQSFNYNGEDYAVNANTVTDEAAYNDAMNEYTYRTYLYQQEMNNINARTSIIQAQDRTLELKLKQLDTEHNAVQTEMEAVKAVCKKNVEDSFKTFA